MNIAQKLLGAIFPPYKFASVRKEQGRLFNAIVSSLTDEFAEIKNQGLSARLLGLDSWTLYPEFKFTTIAYGGRTIFKYKRRGEDFKISGLKIFSEKAKRYEEIELLIHDNLITGLRITNSNYNLAEFDLQQINNNNIVKTSFDFLPSEIDIFYDNLNQNVKGKLNPNDLSEIDFGNRTFYTFYEMEDGNYLAVDKKENVFSLVHDARPMATKMKITFFDILDDIANNRFDKEKHLEERYKKSK